MKKLNKIISALLAVIMLLSAFSITAFAEDEETPDYEYNTVNQTLDYVKGGVIKYKDGKPVMSNKEFVLETDPETDKTIVVDTAAERLEYMDLRLEKDGYRLYVDAYSGEIAVENTVTGETLFSNPYNAGADSTVADSVKEQLLSQIVVKYKDTTDNNKDGVFYSYTEAAKRGQIDVKNIRNGIRVEYSIGREQSRMLVPMLIEESSFNNKIVAPLTEALGTGDEEDVFMLEKFKSYYLLVSRDNLEGTNLEYYETKYPLLKKMNFYIFDELQKSDAKLAWVEMLIKTYAPDYTFDDLEEDHLLTGYEAEDKNPPLFRMALEYTLDEEGLNVRLPANGIRFNEALYRLASIDILPYMGAAGSPSNGYTFFPDGSGTLFDFAKIQEAGATTSITAKVYGQDFAYHTISGKLQEEIRYPVYGLVDTYEVVKDTGVEFVSSDYDDPSVIETETKKRGFFAIVEEGDAMMELTSYHETAAHKYNSVNISVYPRPTDTYNVADAISVSGASGEWSVVSSRKYTGGYRVKYIMLTSKEVAEQTGAKDTYDCSYVGMALAYRNYLEDREVLTKLTEDDVTKDIPIYIETFGTIPTTEKILSVPVTVMTPLTSFEDIQQMYKDFSGQGVKNINFILTGYNDGGMFSGVDYDIDWERAVGGKKGFESLLEYAKENEFGIYPDFDFAYHSNNTIFDSVNLRKHAVKTIDNRYANKREYSSTKQAHLSFFELLISPAYFNRFYEHLTADYQKYNPMGISVSTLGYSLNSDFDEDEPYNREDAKKFTIEAFKYLDENYDSVMTSGGNVFSWKYVDHITDIALDSSRYAQSAASVPFLGIVLHGYVQFAGDPINMEGNMDYAMLKAIENGAALKFIVSYRNTDNLKDFEDLSKYYSIRYDIWFDDVVSIYNELNSVLASVQTSAIVDHYFVDGTRVPDADELTGDAEKIIADIIAVEAEKRMIAEDSGRVKLLNARLDILNSYSNMESAASNIEKYYNTTKTVTVKKVDYNRIDRATTLINDLNTANAELSALNAELAELEGNRDDLKEFVTSKDVGLGVTNVSQISRLPNRIESRIEAIEKKLDATLLKELQALEKELETAIKDLDDATKALVDAYDASVADLIELQADLAILEDAKKPDEDAINAKKAEILAKVTEALANYQAIETAAPALAEKYVAIDDKVTEFTVAKPDSAELLEARSTLQVCYDLANEYKDAIEDAEKAIKTNKTAVNNAAKEIKSIVDDANKAAKNLFTDAYGIEFLVEDAKAGYEILKEDGTMNESLLKELEGKVKSIEAKNAEAKAKCDEVLADMTTLYNLVDAYNTAVDGDDTLKGDNGKLVDGIKKVDVDAFEAPAKPERETKVETEVTVVVAQTNTNKYASDDYRIAYVEYENGVAFLLNFNNYAVRAEFDGNVYYIGAYDYLIVGKAN